MIFQWNEGVCLVWMCATQKKKNIPNKMILERR